MGLFGTRKQSIRDTSSTFLGKNASLSPTEAAATAAPLLELSSLFADTEDQEVDPIQKTKVQNLNQDIPAISVRRLHLNKPIPTDTVTPVTETQGQDSQHSSAALDRKKTARTSALSADRQENASGKPNSASRLARRNSIKRSVSRKFARSESRRQLLNLKDVAISEENVSPSLQRRATAAISSTGPIHEELDNDILSKSSSSQCIQNGDGRLSVSPVSSNLAVFEIAKKSESKGSIVGGEVDEDLELSLRDITLPDKGHRSSACVSDSYESSATADVNDGKMEKKEVKPAKARKRPPPLISTEDTKTAPDSASDWPSAGLFGSDGGFMTGGFKITAEGMVDKPAGITREDSDTHLEGEVPQSERNMIIVGSLKEFRAGPTIGAGAAGRVYLGEHVPSKRTMALKTVNVYDKNKRNQLLKELETLSTHVSRYLVRFHGAFYDGCGAVHIALEYMDHGCLSTFVQKVGEIPEKVVQMIALDCVRGLRFLHRHHVLHRDFKTANILLSRRLCCAKLSDFGLARDLNPGVSKVDTFVGTVAYMSPERLHGSQYTYASDIWALGVSVVECLLGRYPFNRPQNYFDYLEATMTENIFNGFHEKGGGCFSNEVRDFVSLCTCTDPKGRPTAMDLLQHPWLKGMKRDSELFGSWLDECRIISMQPTSRIAMKRSP